MDEGRRLGFMKTSRKNRVRISGGGNGYRETSQQTSP